MKIAGVEISHPDKILFPTKEITKADMVKYYASIADKMLPYLKGRPLTLRRFPDGVDTDGFYQKNASDYFPDFIKTVQIETKEGSNTQVYCNSKKSLIYLANQGTISFHIWLSKRDKPEKPDKVVFDLDPPANSFDKVKKAAKKIGDFLKDNGKDPNLMTTGKSGFHIWYTERRTQTFDERRETIKALADEMEQAFPELLTTATRKNKRNGKIFIDYLRNAYGQTSVCPYSIRATSEAGIATPIGWDELSKIESASHYNFENIQRRLGQL
ncbi:non-homologous end-joining DNA ligase [Luteirhabdus pelagi]|jgi:bifunctional non-homologous end joining protein LigD|uniref:non-homologous end-joining DNA ligase n=1 Tax=Luteirhabdus pelagi TaxID=2792783 RepID=UPI0019397974|nr:non-homologous end-joining DNA ligase [Luteirhabdus pelagi]